MTTIIFYIDHDENNTSNFLASESDNEPPMQLAQNSSGENQVFYADQLAPLVNSNVQYLENLELKLKILSREKETLTDYFRTLATVIDSLQAKAADCGRGLDGRDR